MNDNAEYLQLVLRARQGDKDSLSRLTEVAEERLRVDVYRLTLRHDVAQEVVQETLIEMLKVLKDLKDAHKFWPWLYKIALNKLRLHHRKEKRHREVAASAAAEGDIVHDGREAVASAITEELRDIVVGSMRRLAPRQRAVITMRCYREMEYSQIGESMGCSEFAAKMLFYRAKKSLRKELSRYGFGKGMLLTGLILFGKITAPSEAAAMGLSVTAATTKVGVAAGLAVFAASKTGILSLAAAGALAVGTTMAVKSGSPQAAPEAGADRQIVQWRNPAGRGVEECWYYYPRMGSEQVMMRLVGLDSHGRQSYCKWLENSQASYLYDHRRNTVHIKSARIWNEDLSVRRLPTDDAEMSEFISRVEGVGGMGEPVRRDGDGLLVVVGRNAQGDHSEVTYYYNAADEQYFLYGWPTGAKVVDDRDAMHRRGWTYFRVSGHIGGRPVSGRGRLPFVYGAARWNYPWLDLQAGGDLRIVDNGAQARVYEGGRVVARYEGGSFFKGLGRPWTGLHTLDTVRRDAAGQQTWFETKRGAEEGKAEVVLTCGRVKLAYVIDLTGDVVETITLSSSDGGLAGELVFSYQQQVEDAGDDFVPPRTAGSGGSPRPNIGVNWLANLADGRW